MATNKSFGDMLNEYLTYDLLKEEMVKRDYLLTKVEKDNGWKGGQLIVPFKGAGASSVSYGSLTDSADITEDDFVRGFLNSQPEVWGTMKFHHRDLMEHDGSMPEKTFLRILPNAVEDFMDRMKMQVSVNLLNGPHIASFVGAGTVGGTFVVDRPDRLELGQKVHVDDDDSAPSVELKVTAINMETSTITTVDWTLLVAVDLSGYTSVQNARVYTVGADVAGTNTFQSLKGMLLAASNGGPATIFGVTKTAYPFTQAINVDGSGISAANILDKIFDAYVTIRSKGKGNPMEVLMSYKHMGSVLKLLEASKGSFNVDAGSRKASNYGWTEITVGGFRGELKLVAIQELDDDVIMFIDWRALKFHSNGFFKKRIAPDGKHYFEDRLSTGYVYLVDMCLFGDLVLSRPSYCGILHTIPNY